MALYTLKNTMWSGYYLATCVCAHRLEEIQEIIHGEKQRLEGNFDF